MKKFIALVAVLFAVTATSVQAQSSHRSTCHRPVPVEIQDDYVWNQRQVEITPCMTVWRYFTTYAAPLGVSRTEFIQRNRRLWYLAESGQVYPGVLYVMSLPEGGPFSSDS